MERLRTLKDGQRVLLASGAVGALLLAGCTSPEGTDDANMTNATTEVPIVFSDLGGGSSEINVYQGVGLYDADRIVTGTYLDDETAIATCVVQGRSVSSDPSVGELDRTSDQWVLLNNDERQFATTVYLETPDSVIEQLPSCN